MRTALAQLASSLQAQCGGRLVREENLHLTLIFIGSVERAHIDALTHAASATVARAFDLTFDRVGYFRHNHIVWAGTAQASAAAAALEAALRAVLAPLGVRTEDRPYVPHVTLLRDAERSPAARRFAPCLWSVQDFALVESVPAPRGVQYVTRHRWPLRAAAD